MHNIKTIALDLDGTLLNSNKELTPRTKAALYSAAERGIHIVPTTGRFYGGMPEAIRQLPFIKYTITVNGANITCVKTGDVIYKAELPCAQAIEIMRFLDEYPVIYDCYQENGAWMTESLKALIDGTVSSPHYRKMLHDLRKPVKDLKDFLQKRKRDVQKVQLFTNKPDVRAFLMNELPRKFENLCVSSSTSDNVEINQKHANKGEALMTLAEYLGINKEETMAFGDGLNDLSMLRCAGVGVAMANACPEAKKVSDKIALSCDEDGVARFIEEFCL